MRYCFFLLLIPPSISFFFPTSPGCSCSCPTPSLPTCPPPPVCSVAAPCSNPVANYIPSVPASPSYYVPPYSQQVQALPAQQPYASLTSLTPSSFYGGSPLPYSNYIPSENYKVDAPLSNIPPPINPYSTEYTEGTLEQQYSEKDYSEAPKTDYTLEKSIVFQQLSTLSPPTYDPTIGNYISQMPVFSRQQLENGEISQYDIDEATKTNSIAYKTTEETRTTPQSFSPVYTPSPSYNEEQSGYTYGLNSGEATIGTRKESNTNGRRITTEGLTPNEVYQKRFAILKRMRNAKHITSSAIPRTNGTCNSEKLAGVIARAIVDDVSVSKRMVLQATEMAFDGEKFDVFCATGEFSYSIHSRKYCEVTRDSITCFAFR